VPRRTAGIMAKPFVICHGGGTEKRDRIALVYVLCLSLSLSLSLYVCRSGTCVSITASLFLSLFFLSLVNNGGAASRALFAVR